MNSHIRTFQSYFNRKKYLNKIYDLEAVRLFIRINFVDTAKINFFDPVKNTELSGKKINIHIVEILFRTLNPYLTCIIENLQKCDLCKITVIVILIFKTKKNS